MVRGLKLEKSGSTFQVLMLYLQKSLETLLSSKWLLLHDEICLISSS